LLDVPGVRAGNPRVSFAISAQFLHIGHLFGREFGILRQGLVEGQAPPSPLFTGPLIAALSSALLLIAVPRFFGQAAIHATAEVPAPQP
jgi:hypothetical protein